jgi:hypothetical protein
VRGWHVPTGIEALVHLPADELTADAHVIEVDGARTRSVPDVLADLLQEVRIAAGDRQGCLERVRLPDDPCAKVGPVRAAAAPVASSSPTGR